MGNKVVNRRRGSNPNSCPFIGIPISMGLCHAMPEDVLILRWCSVVRISLISVGTRVEDGSSGFVE